MAPSGAKTFGAEFPGAGTRLTCSSGSRVVFPSGVKVILNFAPDGDAAVNGCPVKKVAFMSFGAILRFDEICDHWELIMFCAPAQGWQRKYHDLARSAQSRQ